MQAELALYNAFCYRRGPQSGITMQIPICSQHLDALREIGVNQVNIDPYIEPAAIMEKIPGVIIHGQIPPTSVLLYGTAEEIQRCVKRDIEQAGPYAPAYSYHRRQYQPRYAQWKTYTPCAKRWKRWGYIYE